MKLVCITQKPIQTLILIYLLAKYKIFFDKIFYFKKNPLQNFNTNQEGINSISALKYQCKIMRIKLIELTPKNQLKLIKYLPRKKKLYGISLISDFILKKKIIERVRGGIFSTHAGILPNFRGVDTNKWSILSGNKFVGITLYKLDEGVDTGKIIKVIKYKYKGNFKNHTEINKDLYYNYKLYLLLDLIKNLSKGKKISYKKNKKNFSQFFKMSKKNTKIVNYKLNTN